MVGMSVRVVIRDVLGVVLDVVIVVVLGAGTGVTIDLCAVLYMPEVILVGMITSVYVMLVVVFCVLVDILVVEMVGVVMKFLAVIVFDIETLGVCST